MNIKAFFKGIVDGSGVNWSLISSWRGSQALSVNPGEQLREPAIVKRATATTVTVDTALSLSTVWACAELIASTVASLPCYLYEKKGKKLVLAEDHPLYAVLHESPNRYMDPSVFFETQGLNEVLQGNSFALKEFNSRGDVIELIPLAASQMQVFLQQGKLLYAYTQSGQREIFPSEKIFHVRGMGNGYVGLSPLAYARNAVDAAQAAEQFGTAFHANAGKPGGVLTIDHVLSDDQRDAVKRNFVDYLSGADNAFKLLVLEAAMQYQQVQLSPEDSQMLQTKAYSVEELCRFFYRVPPVLIGHTEKTTTWGTGVEQILLGFFSTTIRPILRRKERAIRQQLLLVDERRRYEVEFDFADLLRADSAARSEFYSKMVNNGLMTRNEAREVERLPPIDGADQLTVQGALIDLKDIGTKGGVPSAPADRSKA